MGLISEIFLPLALAFIMFSLGLSLSKNDFVRVFQKPKDFLFGALSQIIILPLVALLLVLIWPLSPELCIGVMLIAAAPGGATSNIISSFAKGDVALSVSLTAIISLLCVFTIPFIVLISLELFADSSINNKISITEIAIQMFLIVTIPVIIGMLFRNFFSNFSITFESISRKISTLLFVIVLLGAILDQKNNVIEYFTKAGLVTLVLNILMMFIAFTLAKLLKTGLSQQKTITIECGLQNGTLAIVVASSVFPGESVYLIPAATYSLIMFVTSLTYVYFSRKIN